LYGRNNPEVRIEKYLEPKDGWQHKTQASFKSGFGLKDAFFVFLRITGGKPMKKIECIIRSEKLKDLTDSLREIGVGGMTVSEARGFGVQNSRPDNFLFVHKTKIEVYATNAQVKEIVSKILMHCQTGKIGDGKIAVLPLDDCVRVRTGERKSKAVL
jgi:nitrogen regulatory protein P-II 1